MATEIAKEQLLQVVDFLKKLDSEGVSAEDFVKAFKTTQTAPATVIEEKLKKYQSNDTSYRFHDTVIPRIGGVDGNGIWTGLGITKAGKGKYVKGYNCYRDLDLGTKTLKAVADINEVCKQRRRSATFPFAHDNALGLNHDLSFRIKATSSPQGH